MASPSWALLHPETDGRIPHRAWEEWLRGTRALHTLQFSPHLPGAQKRPPSSPSSLHYHQIIFLEFTHACGSVFSHSAHIFFLISLSLLGLFSIYWFFFLTLWLPTVNIIPTHSIKDLLFQKRDPIGDAACLDMAFLVHRLGLTLTGQKEFIIQWSMPQLCPKNIK